MLAFWVFHVIRDYAHTLQEEGSRYASRLPELVDVAVGLELAVGPIDLVFGHNDLLAGNFIDDGERVWLIDWDYAGFNSPLFDLANLASNNEFDRRRGGLDALDLFRAASRRWPAGEAIGAMKCASLLREAMWSMVSERSFQARIRLRRLYARLHGPLRTHIRGLRARPGAGMSTGLPAHAEIVVIGGGIIGCSTAYHLARDHKADVVLIERGRLTGGSTWHAAGLVGQLRSSASITQVLRYSVDLYKKLESETGLATGWRETGCLRLACNQDRWTEFRRQATTAHSFGLDMHLLSPAEAKAMWPLMEVDDLVGATFLPSDGQASPSDITQSLAKGARMHGAQLFEGVACTGFAIADGRIAAVETDHGTDRLRQGGDRRRHVVAAGRRHGRRQRAAAAGQASIRHHREDRRRRRRHRDGARSRPAHLFQGGGRRARLRRLRAEPDRLDDRRRAREFRVPALRRRLGPFRAAHGGGARAHSGACRPPASSR